MESGRKSEVDTKRASRMPIRGKTFRVKSTSSNGIQRHVTVVSDSGKETRIKLHKTALIGPEDRLHFDPVNSTRIFVASPEDADDLIPIAPHFERRQRLRLGGVDYEI